MQRIFPEWCAALGLNAELVGVDLPLTATEAEYRRTLETLQADEAAAGALVTSHKIGVLQSGDSLFTHLDPYAERLKEVACIVRRPDGSLHGSAKDPITSMQALRHIVPDGYWRQSGAHVLCIGAGGSGQAFLLGLLDTLPPEERPRRMILVARNARRIVQARAALEPVRDGTEVAYALASDAPAADALLDDLTPGSLVANATGMGKDTPGSPLTGDARFPEEGIAWDFNYRGDLLFLQQAARQRESRGVRVHDGWVYFLYGWMQVMAEVFGFRLDEETFHTLSVIAEPYRPEPIG